MTVCLCNMLLIVCVSVKNKLSIIFKYIKLNKLNMKLLKLLIKI